MHRQGLLNRPRANLAASQASVCSSESQTPLDNTVDKMDRVDDDLMDGGGRGTDGASQRAPSPSVLSTASSESPLVRNGSSASTSSCSSAPSRVQAPKRPAPTSIAAAQLQQQLELPGANKSSHSAGNKLAHMAPTAGGQATFDWLPVHQKQATPGATNKKKKLESSPSGKSLGYNVAKSLAFRANR